MNRSTNLLHNTRLYLPDPFTSSFSHLPNPMRGLSQQYSFRDNTDNRRQIPTQSGSETDLMTNPSNRVNILQPRRMYEEPQKSSFTPYTQLFSNVPAQNRLKSRFSQHLIMEPSIQGYPGHSAQNNLEQYNNEDNRPLMEALRNNQFQTITRHRFISPTLHENYSSDLTMVPNQLKNQHSILRHHSEENSGRFVAHPQQGHPLRLGFENQQLDENEGSVFEFSEGSEENFGQAMNPRPPKGPQKYIEEQGIYKNEVKELGAERIDSKTEELLEKIEKYELNPISLLNEVSGKLKKKIEYKTTEAMSSGRTKTFECVCLLDGQAIGIQTGPSKQSAKTEAAYNGIQNILVEENYVTEGAALLLCIQKACEKVTKQEKSEKSTASTSQISQKSVDLIQPDFQKRPLNPKMSSESALKDTEHHHAEIQETGQSSLIQLNRLSKKYATEPVWSFPVDSGDQGCEVKLQFGDFIVEHKGKNKLETKKEAAIKMLEKITEAESLKAPEPEKEEQENQSLSSKRAEHSRKLFMASLRPNLMDRIQTQEKVSTESIQDNTLEFENKFSDLVSKYKIDPLSIENLENFFKKIIDYTSMITSYPKQIMFDAPMHPADYMKDCYLVPVGSFALGCMRNDKLTIDSILTFQKMKEISEIDLLELYKHSLETCYSLDQKSGTNTINMNYQFNIKTNNQGTYMEITETGKTHGKLKINIFVKKQAETELANDFNLSTFWVYQMYKCLDQSVEELNLFRNLLTIMKIWRRKSELHLIRPEIIDTILLDVFLARNSDKINQSIIKSLTILSSEKLTNITLSKIDIHFKALYEGLSDDLRKNLTETCRKSLECIFQNDFLEAKLC